MADIENIQVFYTGKKARSHIKQALLEKAVAPENEIVITHFKTKITLSPGIHYFLVTADIAKNAIIDNELDISIPSFTLNKQKYIPQTDKETSVRQKIAYNNRTHTDVLKVLQWNIWHGGVHLGNEGVNRVIELIKSTNADVITLQEAYGSQNRIADSLQYEMISPSAKDNLALFSRYNIKGIPSTYNKFNSNPGKITLPNGRSILVNSMWLRYAYRPEYTSVFPDKGLNTNSWLAEDSILGLVDIENIVEKDTKPIIQNKEDMPVIFGGDFNSFSHLDWTEAAKHLHFGYGPIAFPISKYLINKGFTDSFREINPDEVSRPEGTWAVIYGQLQVSRIDFLYYKGKGIKAVASKIIRTAPEIDDVWPSDHAAVFTTFLIDKQ